MRLLLLLLPLLLLVGCGSSNESKMESCINQLEEYMGEQYRENRIEKWGDTPEEADFKTKENFTAICMRYGEEAPN